MFRSQTSRPLPFEMERIFVQMKTEAILLQESKVLGQNNKMSVNPQKVCENGLFFLL
jgi:hypothetical protein